MKHIMKGQKSYQSKLRKEHMEQTRDLILEGLIKTMAKGIVTWSIPDVARDFEKLVREKFRDLRDQEAHTLSR